MKKQGKINKAAAFIERPLEWRLMVIANGLDETSDMIEEARRKRRRGALELAYRLRLRDTLFASVRLAAMASGWDEAVVAVCIDRMNTVHEEWMTRRQGIEERPTFEELSHEVGLTCDAYSDFLNKALPPLLEAANERRLKRIGDEWKRAEDELKRAQEARFEAAAAKMEAAAAKMEAEAAKVEAAACRGAKSGARYGVVKYNNSILLAGKKTTRKNGGGRKAEFDVAELQCKALLALGEEYRNGKANPPATYAAYADRIIRNKYTDSDNPFVYPAGANGVECGKVRSKLLHRFDTFLRHQSPPMTRNEALPLAGATE